MWADTIIIFMLAFITSYILTPVTMRLAKKIGALDIPDNERKRQKVAMPRIGGLAVIIGFFVSLIFVILVRHFIDGQYDLVAHYHQIIVISFAALLLSVVTFIDDYKGVSAIVKLIAQITAAVIVIVFGGVSIGEISLPISSNMINLGKTLEFILTLGWIVGITNAINLIDGLDGLSSGIILIACSMLTIIFILNGSTLLSVFLAVALAGSVGGFIPFNTFPAKTYVGDIGSNFMGFMISIISIIGVAKTYTALVLIAPLFILIIPVIDTVFGVIRRIIKYKKISGIFKADRGHIHHRLIDRGFTTKQAVYFIYIVSSLIGMLTIILINGGIVKTICYIFILALILLIGKKDIMRILSENLKEKEKRNN